jgi:carbamoyltransferase
MASISTPSSKSILGLHVTGAQSGAALFQGGTLVAAVAEERLTRQKRTRSFPFAAIDFCLREGGLADLREVDHIVVPWNPEVHMRNINLSGFTSWRRYDPEWLYIVPNQLMRYMPGAEAGITALDFGLSGQGKFAFVSHHHAHIGWAFASPFDEAAVAIVDEYGEATSLTFAEMRGNRIRILKEVPFPHSLGVFYATFTEFLGFRPNADEWKVMGAAAYGDAAAFAVKLRHLVRFEEGDLWLDQTYFEFGNVRFSGYFSDRLVAYLGIPPRGEDEPLDQAHYDLAASCQLVFEEILFAALRWLHAQLGIKQLVLNGGCCMNSLANGKIVSNTPFESLYISPAAADNGTCISGPMWLYHLLAGEKGTYRTEIPAYTGPSFTDAEIRAALDRYKVRYRTPDDILGATVELLCAGRIVGWFQGRVEFGERALGNRSILGDPRDERMKDRINRSVKYREAFRPFAPSVLAERASEYFELPPGMEVKFMEQVYPVQPEKRSQIPAVVHRDGTGRLQTVTEADNPRYHALIERFAAKTGVPVILNTSFNINGEPIVTSPEDALRTFVTSGIDALAIGDCLLEK